MKRMGRSTWLAGAMLMACGTSNPAEQSSSGTGGDAAQGGAMASITAMSSAGGDWTERDECALEVHDCHEHATCIDTPGYYTCECNPGYEGDGVDCRDIDECTNGSHDCAPHASCTNEPGSHSCSCNPGFVGSGTQCRARYKAIVLGDDHSCGLLEDGRATCWGQGTLGQLGHVTRSHSARPLFLPGNDWIQLSAGAESTCGIKMDGSLWCWGYNYYGALGHPGSGTIPEQTGTETDWINVTVGDDHACGIRPGGKLHCWGRNNQKQVSGQHGSSVKQPVAIDATSSYASVALGRSHSCGIKLDGTLWCWGDNGAGKLGIGTPGGSYGAPQQVGASSDWTQVTTGSDHSCALNTAGEVWCWGYGKSGQLGTGAITDAPSPQLAGGGHLYASLSSGKATTCGLRKDDNTLWCWGASEYGQFGDVEPASATPKLLIADKDIQQLAVGGSHLCVLRADERIECWGGAGYGQTGRGVMATESSPRLVDSGTTWTTVVSYTNGTCAKQTDGSLWCWGKNNSGQLGLGDLANRRIPTKRTESANWSVVTLSDDHGCGIQTNGSKSTLWCWGSNLWGQLGTDGVFGSLEPSPQAVGSAEDWASVTAGSDHSCALKSSGQLHCWGRNQHHEVTSPASLSVYSPVHVSSQNNLYSRAMPGHRSSCALRQDQTLWCWGKNTYGELGMGDETPRTSPSAVGTDNDWEDIRLGQTHACGLKGGGQLYCWGSNFSGKLGLGDTQNRNSPERVGTQLWSHIATATYHSCGIKVDGSLWCWGLARDGRLGIGPDHIYSYLSPQRVGTENNWAALALGFSHSCALNTNGQLYCWGSGKDGQTGVGNAWSPTPTIILNP